MIKQVIIIRTDLNMRKGKMIAQGAHASMKVFFDRLSPCELFDKLLFPNGKFNGLYIKIDAFTCDDFTDEMYQWMKGSFKKIVVGINSLEELLYLQKKAEEARIPNALIKDNGLTEFNGKPTITCLAIGPAKSEDIDLITGKLKLL